MSGVFGVMIRRKQWVDFFAPSPCGRLEMRILVAGTDVESMSPGSEITSRGGVNTSVVLLLSGGVDSVTLLFDLVAQRQQVHALSFHYGQRHHAELNLAYAMARRCSISSHRTIRFDAGTFGNSSLIAPSPQTASQVPQASELDPRVIPSTYVPGRNLVLLSVALSHAESLGASSVYLAANRQDSLHYPDCRPEFIAAMNQTAALGLSRIQQGGAAIEIRAPYLAWNKSQIMERGLELGIDYAQTLSCYDPREGVLACGRCGACHLRREGFVHLGYPDPTRYAQAEAL